MLLASDVGRRVHLELRVVIGDCDIGVGNDLDHVGAVDAYLV